MEDSVNMNAMNLLMKCEDDVIDATCKGQTPYRLNMAHSTPQMYGHPQQPPPNYSQSPGKSFGNPQSPYQLLSPSDNPCHGLGNSSNQYGLTSPPSCSRLTPAHSDPKYSNQMLSLSNFLPMLSSSAAAAQRGYGLPSNTQQHLSLLNTFQDVSSVPFSTSNNNASAFATGDSGSGRYRQHNHGATFTTLQNHSSFTQLNTEQQQPLPAHRNPPHTTLAKSKKEESVRFPCAVCGRSFKSSTSLENHARTHNNRDSFACVVCSNTFNNFQSLVQHMGKHKEVPEEHKCTQCDQIFTSAELLEAHAQTHIVDEEPPPELILCSICRRTFQEKEELTNHMRSHIKLFKCEFCAEVFIYEVDLKKHLKTHGVDPDPPPPPPTEAEEEIQFIGVTKLTARRHSAPIETRKREEPKKTSSRTLEKRPITKKQAKAAEEKNRNVRTTRSAAKAEKAAAEKAATSTKVSSHFTWDMFSKKAHLLHIENWLRKCMNMKPIRCEKCKSVYFLKNDLHANYYNENHYKAFLCEKCYTQSFATPAAWTADRLAQFRQYQCTVCEKIFVTGKFLHDHILTKHAHLTDSKTCGVCNKRYSNAPQHHARTHSNATILTCPWCEDIFFETTDLKSHFDTHYADKKKTIDVTQIIRFNCFVCGEIFADDELLQFHLFLHMSESSVRLEDEFYPFSITELKWHDAVKNCIDFVCSFCKSAFPDHEAFKEHVDLHVCDFYKCPECFVTFEDLDTFQTHAESHYAVTQCVFVTMEMDFTRTQGDLKRHDLLQELKCVPCQKSFAGESTGTTHMRQHWSENNVTCLVCRRSFEEVSALKNHVITNHAQLRWHCKICLKYFRCNDVKHMKGHLRQFTTSV